MIEAIELTKKYQGYAAVNRISFQVREGETLGLVGTSGCGKSTTLKMLNRLIEPSSGRIIINGQDVQQIPPEKLRRGIGYSIQNSGLFPHYTVAENVAVVPRLLKWKEKRINQRTQELLAMVGLPPEKFLQRYPQELSGGQKQRVGLARALAADPPLILLDEPFGALDGITRHQIQLEFKQLKNILGKTVILVTHDIFEAVTLCDRLSVMDRGIIQQIGTSKELIFQPSNYFVRDLFASQRFQLELYITTLGDLIPWLSFHPLTTEVSKSYDLNQNLLTVLTEIDTSWVRICDRQQQVITTTNSQDLLKAFYQFKNSLISS